MIPLWTFQHKVDHESQYLALKIIKERTTFRAPIKVWEIGYWTLCSFKHTVLSAKRNIGFCPASKKKWRIPQIMFKFSPHCREICKRHSCKTSSLEVWLFVIVQIHQKKEILCIAMWNIKQIFNCKRIMWYTWWDRNGFVHLGDHNKWNLLCLNHHYEYHLWQI